ncbi:MAG: dienelactone hydrolase family protein [Pseudomonadota bacterium]
MSDTGKFLEYEQGGAVFEPYFVHPGDGDRPLVLVCHAWGGQHDFERSVAADLAAKGYAAFAVDLYGKGKRGNSPDENTALMTPLVSDRARLQSRLAKSLELASSQPGVLPSKTAALGFCFGGLCVLDIARMGADVTAVVSFHGLLSAADNLPSPSVTAKVLALHGWDDPLATPENVIDFGKEMDGAGADWQLYAYGGTVHAFTNPEANDKASGNAYSPTVTRRAWAACDDFLAESFMD